MSNDIPDYSTMSRNRDAAIRALAEMPVKPIRIMGPMDYFMKNMPPAPKKEEESKADAAYLERENIRKRCVHLLRALGAQTTAQLARELKKSSRAVSCALGEIPGISREQVNGARNPKTGHVSREVLWMLPISRELMQGVA